MLSTQTDLSAFMARLEAVAREAGDIAMAYFRPAERTSADVNYKRRGSPVTEADLAVDRFLFEQMASLAPGAGWLSEETADTAERLSRGEVIVVDPIDGTTAFVRGDKRWAVSIALIEQGCPVVGVVHAPALGKTFAARKGGGPFLTARPSAYRPEKNSPARASCRLVTRPSFSRNPPIALKSPAGAVASAETNRRGGGRQRPRHRLAGRARLGHRRRRCDIERGWRPVVGDRGRTADLQPRELASEMLVAAPRALFNESLALAKAAMKGKP